MVVGELMIDTDVVVLGGGPGGYTAAIHAADLGLEVVLVESRQQLGGVCLTEGCIPSKTLIQVVELATSVKAADRMGINTSGVEFDTDRLRSWIQEVVGSLTKGVTKLVENRDIEVFHGVGRFSDSHTLYIEGTNTNIKFKHAIIATGSRINTLPDGMAEGVWTSAQALTLPCIPDRLLVIGGGYIGLEMGQAYAGLGSQVSLVEYSDELLTAVDRDLFRVVFQACKKQFEAIHTGTKVVSIDKTVKGFKVVLDSKGVIRTKFYDQVLAATGREPNTDDIGLERTGIEVDEKGLIETDEQCRTRVNHMFAIGDVTHGPALAHKASRQGKVAAQVIAGEPAAFDNVAIPAVLFTHPQIAWTGMTEEEAKRQGRNIRVGKFPLTALGRAKAADRTQGFVKVIADEASSLVLGVCIVGEQASELIAEGTLAIEMGATLEDLMVSIHPHPTFSESLMEAAEMAATGSVHLMKKG